MSKTTNMCRKCYECKHRRDLDWSAHSKCINPLNAKELDITGYPHGIKMGWFSWPVNFDPVWLENCNGFEQKEGN